MALAMLFKLAVLLAAAPAASGNRALPLVKQREARYVGGYRGLPTLEVLRTSSPTEVVSFLAPWSGARDFGLFVQLASEGGREQRVAVVAISNGARVMIYDLRPFLRQEARPLTAALANFLGDEQRTFYGFGLLRPAAQFAKEFNVSMKSVDMRVRAWPGADLDGGVFRVAERLLGVSFPRRPSLRQLEGQAVAAHLQWAVARHCVEAYGAPEAAWRLTETEVPPARKYRAMRPRHIFDAAEEPIQKLAQLEQALRRRTMQRLANSWPGQEKRVRYPTARESRGRSTQQAAPRAGQ